MALQFAIKCLLCRTRNVIILLLMHITHMCMRYMEGLSGVTAHKLYST